MANDSYYGVGAGRRKTLDALEQKPPLDPIEEPETLEEICEAVEEIRVDGYMSPPEQVIEKIRSLHQKLPEDAKPEYITDETLIQRINSARNQFETTRGKLRRMKEMPSPVEAGPANYPAKRARRRVENYHDSRETLEDRLDRIKAAAGGARQRALEAIGSSVAEQNEIQREETREDRQNTLEKGMLVAYRSPRLHIGKVKRVNKKSVRVKRPNPRAGQTKPMSDEMEPEFRETRVDLDSSHLTPLRSNSDLGKIQSPSNTDCETLPEIRADLFGEEK